MGKMGWKKQNLTEYKQQKQIKYDDGDHTLYNDFVLPGGSFSFQTKHVSWSFRWMQLSL